ncbi:hypothetical protein E4P29_12630 [Rhodococcus sp. 1R11]|uniref:alpha/beta hydrolase n=1 Tax=Rhodococcus sp. 1R11 TaxID=2559614 RepID=UPI001072DDD3|nr:alpha/beta hydrolase [Rhodococcus sp. 1R11]TFI43073.1 hypothetical protein E4P29_12630 [Rhodococcus sp. 1R11]
MVTLDDVRSWDSQALTTVSNELMHCWRGLAAVHSALLETVVDDGWQGPAATAYRDAIGALRAQVGDCATELLRVALCTAPAAIDMAGLVSTLTALESNAAREHFDIRRDGSVTDVLTSYSVAQQDLSSTIRDRRHRCTELAERITQLMRAATAFDEDLARRLAGDISPGTVVRAGVSVVPLEGSPATNAAFWSALSPAERTRLLVEQPSLIGNLDGLPGRIRDCANRRVLASERLRLQAVAEELGNQLKDNTFGGLFSDADAGLEQTQTRLSSLDAIETTLAQGDRQLLALDNSTYTETTAAIAVGDVDTATHVAVFVPGLGSTVHGDAVRYDGDLENLKTTVEQMLSEDPPPTVAAVTWMNYQAPQLGWGLLDPDRTVASDAAAQAGATRLVPFLEGLDVARSNDPHLSVLAHSYGSLTAAAALHQSTGVDEFVSLGSPGLGTGSVTELQVPDGHVFAAEARGDIVADIGAFGRDPGTLDGVTQLATDEADGRPGATGHSDYLTEGSSTEHTVGLVVAGRGEDAEKRSRPGLFDLLQKLLYL